MTARKITCGGLMTAFAILLPQAFHLTGIPQSGQIFLPMHIPVLISGFVLGPVFGLFIGVLSPIISSLLTGMPDSFRLPFMIAELASYGFMSGILYNTFGVRHRKGGIYITLISAMIFGRLVYAGSLLFAGEVLNIKGVSAVMAVNAAVAGIYGIIIQLLFIPSLVYSLERSGYLDSRFRKSQNTAV